MAAVGDRGAWPGNCSPLPAPSYHWQPHVGTSTEEARMRVRKAVIPAAGLGTRFLPASKVVPKEMLPIVDRPVIQYVVEEAVAAGIEQIVIVTAQTKRSIEDHFDTHFELEARLEAAGKQAELEEIRRLARLA